MKTNYLTCILIFIFFNLYMVNGAELEKNKLQWPPKVNTDGIPQGWETFTPRSEITPQCTYSKKVYRNGIGALTIYGNRIEYCYGGWRTSINGIESEKYYAFEGYCKTENVENIRENTIIFLRWKGDFGPEVAPDCITRPDKAKDGWQRFYKIVQAPIGATSVQLELALKWSGEGKIWWDDLSFTQVQKPDSRPVKICTTFLLPKGISSEENVKEFCQLIDRAAEQNPDIILLSETITIVHVDKTYQQAAEDIPNGPTSQIMSAKAREHHVNLIYSVNERDDRYIYCTAVLLNRQGEMIGKYRKTHLPQEELKGGVSPGEEFPVFDTDFGKIGIVICIETGFPEPAREIAGKGAEIIFAPTWGANPIGLRTRAIDNGVYMVNAGYDVTSMIINPLGKVLASADKTHGDGLVFAEIDLSKEFRQPWLGNWKDMKTVIRRENPDD